MTAKKTSATKASKPADKSKAAKKSAYTRKAEAKLEETKAQLDGVRAKVKGAVADGQLEFQAQLKSAEKQADTHLATVQRRLARLQDAGEDSWEDLKEGVENAWDDLAKSIKKIVARFS